MFELQSHFIFPAHAVAKAGPLPKGAELLSVGAGNDESLKGVYIPADDAPAAETLILGFGGNAWNGQDVAEYLHELYPDDAVVAFHYRGYAPSTGQPSAEALIEDAPLVYDAAVERVKPKRVIVVGFSIGSGVAATLAGKRKMAGVILVTPFDSLKAVAQSMYPWLPIGHFFDHEIDAVGALKRTKVPVVIIAAERDEIVPGERTTALAKNVPNLVFEQTIRGAGHNDIYARSDFQDAMHDAADKLEA